MKLFIDDVRIPSDVGLVDKDWWIVRDYFTAINFIDEILPQEISFDHDLGILPNADTEYTGYDIAKWMIEEDLKDPNVITKDFKFNVHSANPVGKENIESLLNNYIEYKFGE